MLRGGKSVNDDQGVKWSGGRSEDRPPLFLRKGIKMPVYVDNMNAKYGRMVMCHMLADTDEELHEMADRIGVSRRWHQAAGTHRSHYDICLAKKVLAIHHGATPVTRSELGQILRRKRKERAYTDQ